MKWSELIESRKTQLLLALLLVLIMICAGLTRACSKDAALKLPDGEQPVQPTANQIFKATFVVSFPSTNEAPITFNMESDSDGIVRNIPDIGEMEHAVWTGWTTESGEPFDFNKALTEDIVIVCAYYDDLNDNDIADGAAEDPITVYRFLNVDGTPLNTKKFFGIDVEFDYSGPEYAFPQQENDGYVFLGWKETRECSEDGGTMVVNLMPSITSDRNNNDLADGSEDDRYIHHIFLDQNGDELMTIYKLAGEDPVRTEEIACPTTTKQKLIGWNRTESTNDAGDTVYTYTPNIVGN